VLGFTPTLDQVRVATNDALPMNWFFDLNGLKDTMYLTFFFVRHKYLLYHHRLSSVKELYLVTREVFKLVVDNVKQYCEGVAKYLIKELEQCFIEHHVMTTLNMVYFQFYAKNPTHANEEFHW
jgi:hypothetical protein